MGCRGEYHLAPTGDDGNAIPLAQAGTGSFSRVRSSVTLDARDSFDPDGQIVAYHWKLVSAPVGSAASLVDADTSVASIAPDQVGTYAIQLEVEDDEGAVDFGDVAVTVTPPTLAVNAGTDVAIPWLGRAQLSGAMSIETPFTASYAWTFVSKPSKSAAMLTSASSLTPKFFADVEGTYTLALTAMSEFETRSDQRRRREHLGAVSSDETDPDPCQQLALRPRSGGHSDRPRRCRANPDATRMGHQGAEALHPVYRSMFVDL